MDFSSTFSFIYQQDEDTAPSDFENYNTMQKIDQQKQQQHQHQIQQFYQSHSFDIQPQNQQQQKEFNQQYNKGNSSEIEQNYNDNKYVNSIQQLVQFQTRKKLLIKKKIQKKIQKNKEKIAINPDNVAKHNLDVNHTGSQNIFKLNLKPNTCHIPTLFMNMLSTYLLEFYQSCKNFSCLNPQIDMEQQIQYKFRQECDCQICTEFFLILTYKQSHANTSLKDLKKLIQYPRIRALSENFIQEKAYHVIQKRKNYRQQSTQISLLLSLQYFLKGVQNPSQFYKLI